MNGTKSRASSRDCGMTPLVPFLKPGRHVLPAWLSIESDDGDCCCRITPGSF
ncbi:hypothetical protein [Paenibacillus dendritiformis]|uniref:hypothetical protein n=1 Tax=Paenibacillus dendritiformis TaxID=130049 RepID=UPI00387E144A